MKSLDNTWKEWLEAGVAKEAAYQADEFVIHQLELEALNNAQDPEKYSWEQLMDAELDEELSYKSDDYIRPSYGEDPFESPCDSGLPF